MRVAEQETSNGKGMYEEYKGTENNDETEKYEAPQEFERLAETISDWFTPIIRMWRFTKNNGITEGFHRKMKLIQRMAYGYRNFQNYRLRVLVLCGVFH